MRTLDVIKVFTERATVDPMEQPAQLHQCAALYRYRSECLWSPDQHGASGEYLFQGLENDKKYYVKLVAVGDGGQNATAEGILKSLRLRF